MAEPSPFFCYAVYGLTVSSDVPFPELCPATTDTPDVRIHQGSVPEHLDEPKVSGVLFETTTDGYLLRVHGVASYWARAGREILIDPEESAPPTDVRTFLYGSVFTALLHQRGVLVLHAAGIVGSRGAVLLAGHSGSGKSTLLAALAKRGYSILTDDAAAVSFDASDRLMVQPGFPEVGLWKAAAARLGHWSEALRRVRPGIEKYSLPVESQFSETPQPLAAVYVLDVSNDDHVVVEPLENSARFEAVRVQTRNLRVLEGLEMTLPHFKLVAAVAAGTPVVRLVRPRGRDSLDELVTRVEQSLQ